MAPRVVKSIIKWDKAGKGHNTHNNIIGTFQVSFLFPAMLPLFDSFFSPDNEHF